MSTATAPKRTRKRAQAAEEKTAKQTRIDGTYDEIPKPLKEKVDDYVTALRKRQKAQESENVLRAEVIALMHEHDVELVPLDETGDEGRDLILDRSEKIKIKKRGDAGDE